MALAAATSAYAADFKGFYAGVNVGGAWGSANAFTSTVFSPTGYFATTSVPAIATAGAQQLRPTRFTGGFQAGYNFQRNNWLLGVEADMGSMHLNDTASKTAQYPCCAPTNFTVTQSINTSWLFTLRPRFGFVAGSTLLYGTAGLAVTNRNFQEVFTDTFATAAENGGSSENARGWTAGGGAEFKSHQHWSYKAEYLYANFGDVSVTSTNLTAFTPPIAFPTNVFTHRLNDFHVNLFRFGVNYHF